MLHPNELRVEKKILNIPKLTLRKWEPQFLCNSDLFFPIMPYAKFFSNKTDWPNLNVLNKFKPSGIKSWTGQEINFVLQKGTRTKEGFEGLYEPRIFLTGEVRTRLQNWHDFFNAQIWYNFPKSKSALNMRQFIAFDENANFPWNSPPSLRIREQDFMTMFDEGGCILAYTKNFTLPFLFGHALYERILLGENNLSMCTIKIPCPDNFINLSIINQNIFLDNFLSKILANRNTYYGKTPFFTYHFNDAMNLIIKLKEYDYTFNEFNNFSASSSSRILNNLSNSLNE